MVIEIPRGDTCNLHIDVLDTDGNPYTLAEGDILRFTVRKSTSHKDTNPILFQSTGVDVKLTAEVTESLKEGNYVYDVELTQADGTVTTIIGPDTITITPEVTF